jgi:hypothetical protein
MHKNNLYEELIAQETHLTEKPAPHSEDKKSTYLNESESPSSLFDE